VRVRTIVKAKITKHELRVVGVLPLLGIDICAEAIFYILDDRIVVHFVANCATAPSLKHIFRRSKID
jgi:hypothetical protein